MVVTASRQAGHRPETIRTRLARFMPRGAAPAWSVAWSARAERVEEAATEDHLAVAEHLGCFGSAVAHALARAEMAPRSLRLSAEAAAAADSASQPFTVYVRAVLSGASADAALFESIVRNADPMCPVWKSLATSERVRLIPLIESGGEITAAEPVTNPQPKAAEPAPVAAPMPTVARTRRMSVQLGPLPMPSWLTPRFAGLLGVAVAVLAFTQHPWAA